MAETAAHVSHSHLAKTTTGRGSSRYICMLYANDVIGFLVLIELTTSSCPKCCRGGSPRIHLGLRVHQDCRVDVEEMRTVYLVCGIAQA